jgi:hypothetical protein
MQRYLGAFVIGGMVGVAGATTFGSKAVTRKDSAQAAPSAMMVVDLADDHVRHMRAHKQVAEAEETPKASQASGVAEQAGPTVDQTPTGSIKRTRPKKPKRPVHKKKIAGEQDAVVEEAPSVEIESPAPRGIFEALFHGD